MLSEQEISILKAEVERHHIEITAQFPKVSKAADKVLKIMAFKDFGINTGSAFVFQNKLITALHTLDGANKFFLHSFADKVSRIHILQDPAYSNPELDLAIYNLPKTLSGQDFSLPVAKHTPQFDAEGFVVGFPRVDVDASPTQISKLPIIQPANIHTILDSSLVAIIEGGLISDFRGFSGFSGGAILNRNGELIGMVHSLNLILTGINTSTLQGTAAPYLIPVGVENLI